jgi:hypothetical protein
MEDLHALRLLEDLSLSVERFDTTDLEAIGRCRGLRLLTLEQGNGPHSERGVSELVSLSDLQGLFLTGAFDDEWCALAKELPQLETLVIYSNYVTDRGVAALSHSQSITDLYLDAELITDESVQHVAKMSALQSVTLLNVSVSEEAFQKLSELRPDVIVNR